MAAETPQFLIPALESPLTEEQIPAGDYRFVRIDNQIVFGNLVAKNGLNHLGLAEKLKGVFNIQEDDADYLSITWKWSPERVEERVANTVQQMEKLKRDFDAEGFRKLLLDRFKRDIIIIKEDGSTSLRYYVPERTNRLKTILLLNVIFPDMEIEQK